MAPTEDPPSQGAFVTGLLRARPLALWACVLAVALSLFFMVWVGHRNRSAVLMLLFTFWVSSPFVALGAGLRVLRATCAPTRAALHAVMLVVSVVSPCFYGIVALGPPRAQPAFTFLVVPFASWVLGVVVLGVVAVSGRQRV